VSSLTGPTPEQWNEWIRGHWRIENASHYVRDTAFAENASRIRKKPDIIARLRSFAYSLLMPKAATTSKTHAGAPPSTSFLHCRACREN